MPRVSVCDAHYYINFSLDAKFCPIGGEKLAVKNIEDKDILDMKTRALEMFGLIKGEAGAIDYPRNFNVLTGKKVGPEGGTPPGMKK